MWFRTLELTVGSVMKQPCSTDLIKLRHSRLTRWSGISLFATIFASVASRVFFPITIPSQIRPLCRKAANTHSVSGLQNIKMAKFAFVVVDNSSGKIKHADRELIRSRCMEGVNQRQNSRRSLQAKRQNREAHISSSIGEQDAAQTDPPLADTYPHNHSRAVASGPRLDWELVRFTHSDTPVYPRELMFTSDIFVHVKSTVYPIYNHVDFDDKAVESPLRRLIYDDLFRYAVCFMVSAYKERMRQQPLSDMTNRYYRGTIALLNNKLRTGSDKQAYRDDSTIWCVSILANMALWLAQHAEVSTHTSALKQIIKICGGQAFLLQRPYLRYQLYW